MTKPLASTKPYYIRALHEWCADNGFTPYIIVVIDEMTHVPREFVSDGQIVLNISMDATGSLVLGNEYIEFSARFGGVAHPISIPVARVSAIYARENGVGMGFDIEEMTPAVSPSVPGEQSSPAKSLISLATENGAVLEDSNDEPPKPPPVRPRLRRVK